MSLPLSPVEVVNLHVGNLHLLLVLHHLGLQLGEGALQLEVGAGRGGGGLLGVGHGGGGHDQVQGQVGERSVLCVAWWCRGVKVGTRKIVSKHPSHATTKIT